MFRSLLFVPGSRPDRFGRALAAGADVVCLDLEDAVPPAGKDAARDAARPFLDGAADGPPLRAVRVNTLRSRDGLRDLAALASVQARGGLVVLPKVEDAEEIRIVEAVLAEGGATPRLLALIETCRGLEAAPAIAAASPLLAGLILGGVDLAAELGVDVAEEPLRHARARLVHAAHAAGIEAMDVPCLDVRDPAATEAEARLARRMGFTGKAAIHPAQLAAIHAAFTPTSDQVEWAHRVLRAYRESPGGLAVLDGKLVERPVARRAERVLARARAAGLV